MCRFLVWAAGMPEWESGAAGMSARFGRCLLSVTVIEILPWEDEIGDPGFHIVFVL